jgi:hypothetical protein
VIEIRYKDWLLRCDAETTRAAYARIENGAPERCGCDHCLNFIAQRDQRDQSYPRGVLDLLASLGIDYRREAEVHHLARLPSGIVASTADGSTSPGPSRVRSPRRRTPRVGDVSG